MKLFLAIEVDNEEDAKERLMWLRMEPHVAEKTDRYCIGERIGAGTAADGFVEIGGDFESPPFEDEDEAGPQTAGEMFEMVERGLFGPTIGPLPLLPESELGPDEIAARINEVPAVAYHGRSAAVSADEDDPLDADSVQRTEAAYAEMKIEQEVGGIDGD